MFPPRPTGLRGRSAELATLASAVDPRQRHRLALVGQGGSGKSMLACALRHRVEARFPGGIHWFRVGAWDTRTLGEMLALRFGTPRGRSVLFQGLRRFLTRDRGVFIVLDNHEDDRAMARLLDELRDAPATQVGSSPRSTLPSLGGVDFSGYRAPRNQRQERLPAGSLRSPGSCGSTLWRSISPMPWFRRARLRYANSRHGW